jgi:predicted PurR-regulated permease PerM
MHLPQSVSISTGTFIKAVLIVLGIWFLWFVRDIVAIFVASLLLASIIDPVAHWFSERKVPRGLSVLIVYVLLLSLLSLLLVLLVPIVASQSIQFLSNLSSYYSDAASSFGKGRAFLQLAGLTDNLALAIQGIQESITNSFTSLFSTVKGFFGGLAALFIILVLAFYMVVEDKKVREYFKSLAPIEYQPYVAHLMKKMSLKMGQWMRGQIILGVIVGVAAYIGLSILGVPYALLLALIAGVLEVVPYVGPIISVVPAAVIGFAQSPIIGLCVVALYLIIQQIENHLLVPKVMQAVTGLNPIISILALLIGIKVAGLVGAVFSIPLAMVGVVVLEDLFGEV